MYVLAVDNRLLIGCLEVLLGCLEYVLAADVDEVEGEGFIRRPAALQCRVCKQPPCGVEVGRVVPLKTIIKKRKGACHSVSYGARSQLRCQVSQCEIFHFSV